MTNNLLTSQPLPLPAQNRQDVVCRFTSSCLKAIIAGTVISSLLIGIIYLLHSLGDCPTSNGNKPHEYNCTHHTPTFRA